MPRVMRTAFQAKAVSPRQIFCASRGVDRAPQEVLLGDNIQESAALDQPCSTGRQRQPAEQGEHADAEGGKAGVGQDLVLALAEMDAAVFQARIVADRLATRQVDRLLGVQAGGERFGIGLLVARAQRRQQRVEHRQHLDRIDRLLPRLRLRAGRGNAANRAGR